MVDLDREGLKSTYDNLENSYGTVQHRTTKFFDLIQWTPIREALIRGIEKLNQEGNEIELNNLIILTI